MKAFFVGLISLISVAILSGIGILLFPLFIVLGWALRIIISLAFAIFAVWLLGKFILFIWEKLKEQ